METNELLKSNNKNEVIIIIYEQLSKKCSYGKNLDTLNENERLFYLCAVYDDEMSSGGLTELVYEIYGNYIDNIITSLKKIGAVKNAKLLSKSHKAFPKKSIPNDINERQDIMEDDSKISIMLDKLELSYRSINCEVTDCLYLYLNKNTDKF